MKEYFSAYYYSLPKTGFSVIDKISEAFCRAGKGCHNTADWNELWGDQTETYSQNMQRVVEESATELAQQIRDELERRKIELLDNIAGWAKQAARDVTARHTPGRYKATDRKMVQLDELLGQLEWMKSK